MMKLTINTFNNQRLDIGVNEKQLIKDTLEILQEKEICVIGNIQYIKQQRLQKQISIYQTYIEAGIYEGDTLYI